MKRIALFIHSLEGGGAERVVLTLAREMTRMGHQVHLILLKNKVDYLLDFDVRIHHFEATRKKGWSGLFYYKLQGRRFREFIFRLEQEVGKIDLLISNLTDPDRIMSEANLPRSFFCIHCATSNQKLGEAKGVSLFLRRRKFQKIYNNRDLIVVSDGVGSDLVEKVGVRPRSMRRIYNPLDFDSIRRLADLQEPIPFSNYILHVGSFKEQKRHDILLKSFAKSGLSCQLVLLGQGKNEQEMRTLARQLGVEERVVFAGFKTNPYPWIKMAKLMVLSSDFEGLGMVLVEALVCGVPVVSTDCPHGPAEILTGTLSSGLVPVGDVDALAEKLRSTYLAPIPAQPEGLDRFEVGHVVRQYLSLLPS